MPDMKAMLEQLEHYTGATPCPDDFDAFWDEAVREMEALGTDCELVPADFQVPGARCYHLYFTGVCGARIHAAFARPERCDAPVPAICMYHGYSGACHDFLTLLGYVQAGFAVTSMDVRGQGGLSQDVGGVLGNTLNGHIIRGAAEGDPHKLFYRAVFLDAAQLARIVMAMPEVDENRVGCSGGSQGGALSIACAALTPQIRRIAVGCPFLCDYKRVWELGMTSAAYPDITEYFRKHDPLHEHEDELFCLLGYIDVKNLAHRVRAKTLMFTGMVDTVCPPATQFAAYNAMTCEKEHVLYPDFAHETYPGSGERGLLFLMDM